MDFSFTRRNSPYVDDAGIPKQRSGIMFKVIGAVVVYGFAMLGLATYLEARSNES